MLCCTSSRNPNPNPTPTPNPNPNPNQVLHEQLSHCAALAITHRLLPLLHLFGRVLVFGDGAIVEDGPPSKLLEAPDGHVGSLFAQAPARLQAHTRRMLALKNTRGLHAVHGLWRSAMGGGGDGGGGDDGGSGNGSGISSGATSEPADIEWDLGAGWGASHRALAQAPPLARRGWRKHAFETRELPWSALAAWGDEGEGGRQPLVDEAPHATDNVSAPSSPAGKRGIAKSRSFALAAEGFTLPPALSPDLTMRRLATPAFRADAPLAPSLLAPRRPARPGRQRPPAFARRDELPWAALGKAPLLTWPSKR